MLPLQPMGWLGKLLGGERVVPHSVKTRADFEDLTSDGRPTVLYVWGESCGPCKRMSQEVVAAATKHVGRVQFAEMSTSADHGILSELAIRATPTVIVFDGSNEVGRVTGFRPAGWFDEMIQTEFPDL